MQKKEILSEKLDYTKMPGHIAIIMDGNGRWAKEKGLPRLVGHNKGAGVVRDITRFVSRNLKQIKVLTLYVFSTENWSRPKTEVSGLMKLLKQYIVNEMPEFIENNVRLSWIGRKENLSSDVRESLDNAVEKLSKNTGLILNLAINYGGRAEIVDACKAISTAVSSGRISKNEIDENSFEKFLYTSKLPQLDLIIRTGGDERISNFLLWQMAYAELWVTPIFWPDFKSETLIEAILEYQKRDRRFGSIK